MTFLQALYGSQYQELKQRGSDPARGRFNANLFLTAFIIVGLLVVFMLAGKLSSSFTQSVTDAKPAYMSGKALGKILAIPLMIIIYFVVSRTVGSEAGYQRIVAEFEQLPEEVRAKANQKLLIPFFVLLGVMLIIALSSL